MDGVNNHTNKRNKITDFSDKYVTSDLKSLFFERKRAYFFFKYIKLFKKKGILVYLLVVISYYKFEISFKLESSRFLLLDLLPIHKKLYGEFIGNSLISKFPKHKYVCPLYSLKIASNNNKKRPN